MECGSPLPLFMPAPRVTDGLNRTRTRESMYAMADAFAGCRLKRIPEPIRPLALTLAPAHGVRGACSRCRTSLTIKNAS